MIRKYKIDYIVSDSSFLNLVSALKEWLEKINWGDCESSYHWLYYKVIELVIC